jgi:hypothetical protein
MASKAPVDLSVDSASIKSSAVTVNAEGVASAIQALRDVSSTERHRLMVVLPLKWDNLEQEATFHMLLHILNTTSGAEVCAPLHSLGFAASSCYVSESKILRTQMQARRSEPDRYMAGIRETVLMGLLGLHMEGRKLTASGLAALTLFDFSRAFSLPLTVEKEVMPGVRQDVPAPHRPLVEAMHRTLQDGCRILGERNFTRWAPICSETAFISSFFSFGQCLLSGVDSGYVSQTESPAPLDALATVSRLVRIFPFLRDEVKLGDKSVGLYSKAQQMVIYFHDVLGPRVPACNFANMNALTGCCDSYTLAVLRQLKVVCFSDELSSQIDAGHDFRAGSETEVP